MRTDPVVGQVRRLISRQQRRLMRGKTTKKSLHGKREGETDWARVGALTERELERSIAPIPMQMWLSIGRSRRFSCRRRKEFVHLRIDLDVLACFGSRDGVI